MPAVHAGPMNVFVRSHEASGKMVINYARNPNKFAVNRYTQIVPVQKMAGYYQEWTVEEAGRLLSSTLTDLVWQDGQESPKGKGNGESFQYKPFECTRYARHFALGNLTVEQATWDIVAQYSQMYCQNMMTARTQAAINELTNSSNYAASHVLDVTTITGNRGNWAQSTSARQDIKRSLMTLAEVILDDTLSAIDLDDLVVVINSNLAMQLAQTQEIVDYIKGSPDALAQVRGELPGRNSTMYGLPDKLYGFELVIEKTRKVTSRKGTTRAASQVLANGTPFMCARPGKLEGVANAPNFSTCVCFAYEEMTVETLNDQINRRLLGRVVENWVYKLVGQASGGMFQNVTA